MTKQNPSTVAFDPKTASINCSGCLDRLPLSKATMRNQARIVEELEMMRDVHQDCIPNAVAQSYQAKHWRETMLRHFYNGGRDADRMVYSV